MKIIRKILKKDLIIPAGVFLTDEPELQPRTHLEKALDKYMRCLSEDEFDIVKIDKPKEYNIPSFKFSGASDEEN